MQTLSKIKLSQYSNLKTAKMRRKYGLFVAEGVKCVEDTIGLFELEALIVLNNFDDRKFASKAVSEKTYGVSPADMKKLSALSTPAEVMAVYHIPTPGTEDTLPCQLSDRKFYLVLDGVRDPGNMGTIIRTAHWFGISEIFASKDTVDIYNTKTVQSTMGSIAKVNVTYTDLPQLFKENSEIPVYGLLLDGTDIFKVKEAVPGFIVMGNEGVGLSPEVRKVIESGKGTALTIPPAQPHNHPDSLNVAIATAITLSQLVR